MRGNTDATELIILSKAFRTVTAKVKNMKANRSLQIPWCRYRISTWIDISVVLRAVSYSVEGISKIEIASFIRSIKKTSVSERLE